MKLLVLSLAVLLSAALATAAEDHSTRAEAPVVLMEGLGNHHHPVSTTNPQCQKFFDQGMNLAFAFNHDEAIRAFRRAAELDPKAAMPLWGIALSLGPNINLDVDPEREKAAYEAVQKALKLSKNAPENERGYIEALTKRYSNNPKADLKALAADYAKAMDELSKRYPDDLDLATLHAESLMDLRPWQLWGNDGQPAEDTLEILAILESVLKRDPMHPGANHYYIHAVEASPHPEWGLPSAARLESLVPAAGHLVHMPGHIYARVGDYEGAAHRNVVAADVDHAYIEKNAVKGVYPLMYYTHNLHFLTWANMMAGNYAGAKKAAERTVANVKSSVKEMPMVEFFFPTPTFVALRFQKWDEILRSPLPDRELPTDHALAHFARGVAAAATGDMKTVDEERKAFAAARKKVPQDAMWSLNPAAAVLDVAEYVLEGRALDAKGDPKAAIEAWEKAVAAQESLAYDEPPDWYYPVRESLGASLLRGGQAKEAEKVFREDLQRNPRNPRSLFGLWQSLLAQKKTADVDWVKAAFDTAWKNADTKLRLEDL